MLMLCLPIHQKKTDYMKKLYVLVLVFCTAFMGTAAAQRPDPIKDEERKAAAAKQAKRLADERKAAAAKQAKRLADERKATEAKQAKRLEDERKAAEAKRLAAAKKPATLTETAFGANIAMLYVEGGSFTMGCTSEQGSDCYDNEKPAHTVSLSNFYIGKYEVTQAQWKAVMGTNPSYFNNCDQCPVEQVSWDDIQDFIRKLNQQTGKTYRLPTEAEWEYAARGGNKSKGYKYAGSNTVRDVAVYEDNSSSKTSPVGGKLANELGIHDMSGNVWEWCADWYDGNYYANSSVSNPRGPSSGYRRVLRGGGWIYTARRCRVAFRGSLDPAFESKDNGFRLVLVP